MHNGCLFKPYREPYILANDFVKAWAAQLRVETPTSAANSVFHN